MDAVGKVQGRGVLGQVDGVALWREDEDLVVGEELLLQGLHELLGVVDLAVDVHELVDEVERLVKLGGLAAVFVLVVRGDAVFGHAVHLVGADLDLKGHALVAQER